MKRYVRLLLLAAVLLAGLAGVGYANPALVAELGLDFWNVPELQSRLETQLRRHRELEAQDQDVLRRIAEKDVLIEDLVAGRLDLAQVASQFRDLNGGRSDLVSFLRTSFPGATDDERLCHNVINYATVHMRSNGQYARPLLERLHAELQHLLERGPLVLP